VGQGASPAPNHPFMLHRYTILLAAATLFLVVAGALVTSQEAGLSVPDWPLSYGQVMPEMTGGIFYEHGHRMVATTVGFLTIILAAWLWRAEDRLWMKRLGAAALGAVIFQGLLGGLTVIYLLPKAVSISHACLAQLFFSTTIAIVLFTSPHWKRGAEVVDSLGWPATAAGSLLAPLAVLTQLALGAAFRHKALGLVPHVLGAVVVSAIVLWVSIFFLVNYPRHRALRSSALVLLVLTFSQVFLGVGAYMSRVVTADAPQPLPLMVLFTVAHVAVGALTLASSIILAIQVRRHIPGTLPPIAPYIELTKPRITWLILMSTGIGYYFGAREGWSWASILHTLCGTGLIASGTAALNQWYEHKADALMRRTQDRPIPSGRLTRPDALVFAIMLSVAGFAQLTLFVNPLTGLLGLFTLATYLFLYTPLKSRSPHSTTIGAIPGAMPPLIGYAAAAGTLTPEAWALYAILFVWQFPHFQSIAWMYREDYSRAGIKMLPVVEPDGRSTARQIVWTLVLLIPVSLAPTFLSMTGRIYFMGAVALGLYFLWSGIQVMRQRTILSARSVLLASVAYLPLLYGLMLLDH